MSQYYESNSPKGTVQEHDVIMRGKKTLRYIRVLNKWKALITKSFY